MLPADILAQMWVEIWIRDLGIATAEWFKSELWIANISVIFLFLRNNPRWTSIFLMKDIYEFKKDIK